MVVVINIHKKLFLISIFIILIGCQLRDPVKNHGILFLENRAKQLEISKNNKNDVIRLIGNPHTVSIDTSDNWIYIERTLTKGSFHKLGQNVLKTNNVLILNFDKYGILKNKKFLTKEDKNKVVFSKKKTEDQLTKKSFVEKVLSSVKEKMYSNR